MDGEIQILSLSLLDMASDVRKVSDELADFAESQATPAELLSTTDAIMNEINRIDKSLSYMKRDIIRLTYLYKGQVVMLKSRQRDLVDKIHERKAKAVQLNTNIEIYDKENPLFTFECVDGFSGTSPSFKIVEVTKPEDYTVLSIINTIENVEPLTLQRAEEFVDMVFSDYALSRLEACRTLVIKIKSVLDAPDYPQVMATDVWTTECVDLINTLKEAVGTLRSESYLLKKQFTALFQTFTVIDSNYQLYDKAVNAFSSITLESVCNAHSVYEIM